MLWSTSFSKYVRSHHWTLYHNPSKWIEQKREEAKADEAERETKRLDFEERRFQADDAFRREQLKFNQQQHEALIEDPRRENREFMLKLLQQLGAARHA